MWSLSQNFSAVFKKTLWKEAKWNLESSTIGKISIFASNFRFVDQIYKLVGWSYCLILLNYCAVYAEAKSVVLQPKIPLGQKHWKIIISLIIFMCGDVEKNSRPYNLSGIVQASFSQGHEKIGVTRRIQCTCITLYSLCFLSFKPIFELLSEELDYVIVTGNQFIKNRTHWNYCHVLICLE